MATTLGNFIFDPEPFAIDKRIVRVIQLYDDTGNKDKIAQDLVITEPSITLKGHFLDRYKFAPGSYTTAQGGSTMLAQKDNFESTFFPSSQLSSLSVFSHTITGSEFEGDSYAVKAAQFSYIGGKDNNELEYVIELVGGRTP